MLFKLLKLYIGPHSPEESMLKTHNGHVCEGSVSKEKLSGCLSINFEILLEAQTIMNIYLYMLCS